ncbi:hypothetical protein B4073_1864 [Bacillus subtilis]|nr:hypothetical protein I33_1934 [Bacillus subtilis subsp. subtilis str. RO-NN-1]KIN38538.1 hypothetical protein B4071_1780 [Bacillus subtilis]KIN41446.1 hypothetical protein B4070_1801 [Bacillus subtilis]KIN51340.1 hypothetical protein B4073_1864 [Bacillus subtilis]
MIFKRMPIVTNAYHVSKQLLFSGTIRNPALSREILYFLLYSRTWGGQTMRFCF